MRRWIAILLLPFMLGATRYVKTPCTFNGDGTVNACAGGAGGAGAWNSIANAASAATCGSAGVPMFVNVNDGVYNFNNVTFAQSCTAGNELILQWNGWTAISDINTSAVYFQNTQTLSNTPGVNWTQCTDCGPASGQAACQNIPGTCGEAWFHSPSSGRKALWAVTPAGVITPRKTSLANVTAQYDSFSVDGSDNPLTVRWGLSLPAAPDGQGENNEFMIAVTGDYITFRGIHFRFSINTALQVTHTSDHLNVQGNSFKYFNDSGNGSSRAVMLNGCSNCFVQDNEMAFTSSEPLHVNCGAFFTGAPNGVSFKAYRNWIHNIGDQAVLGAATFGTPNCTTFTNDAQSGVPTSGIAAPWGPGDYTGSEFAYNFLDTCSEPYNGNNGAFGIYLESSVNGLVSHDNIVRGTSNGIEIRPFHSTPVSGGINRISGNVFYNEIIVTPIVGAHDSSQNCTNLNCDSQATPNCEIGANKFYNITCADIGDICLASGLGSGLGVGGTNTFANILCERTSKSSPSNFLVNNSQGGMAMDHNLAWAGQIAGQIGTLSGVAFNCGTNSVVCADPVFIDRAGSDFHLNNVSPARNTGTATGMPAAHTLDICNTIASAHGLPSYADCQPIQESAWDIGADEISAGGPPLPAHQVIVVGSLCLSKVNRGLPVPCPEAMP